MKEPRLRLQFKLTRYGREPIWRDATLPFLGRFREDDLEPDTEEEPGPPKKCPRCGSADTRLSWRRGIFATVLGVFNLSRYRCRACRRRFVSWN